MAIDEQLLNKNSGSSSTEKVGELNQARRDTPIPGDLEEQVEAETWEEAVADRRKRMANGAADKIGTAVAAPLNKGTSRLLQQAWLNLIDSFGLTLIWINIHVFLGIVLGNKLFCKLGEEWTAGGGLTGATGAAGSAAPAPEASKTLGMTEGMGLACCDLGCLLVLIAIVGLVSLMVQGASIVLNPLASLATLLTNIWGAITGSK